MQTCNMPTITSSDVTIAQRWLGYVLLIDRPFFNSNHQGYKLSEEKLEAALKEISQQHWDEHEEPMLFSSLPNALTKALGGLDYREILKGKSFKAFVKASQGRAGYELAEHPTTKARVGLMPAGKKYEFKDAAAKPKAKVAAHVSTEVKNAPNRAIALFTILATLSEEDLEKVVIPASVIVKLLK